MTRDGFSDFDLFFRLFKLRVPGIPEIPGIPEFQELSIKFPGIPISILENGIPWNSLELWNCGIVEFT